MGMERVGRCQIRIQTHGQAPTDRHTDIHTRTGRQTGASDAFPVIEGSEGKNRNEGIEGEKKND